MPPSADVCLRRKTMGYFEDRRPYRNSSYDDFEMYGIQEIYKADGRDDSDCHFHERMKGRRFAQPEAGFAEMNIVYPFIDRNLKSADWTRQDDGSFVLNINGKNAYITFEDGEVLASRWDGTTIYADSMYTLQKFLLP